MSTVADLIGKWPSVSEWARDLGLKRESHGTLMKMRGSIPVAYWETMVEAARRRGIRGVTNNALAKAHAKPKSERVAVGRQPSTAAAQREAAAQ